jgi:hypothetical protein
MTNKTFQSSSQIAAVRTADPQPMRGFKSAAVTAARATTSSSSSVALTAATVVVRSASSVSSVRVPYDIHRESIRRENLRANGVVPDRVASTDDSV